MPFTERQVTSALATYLSKKKKEVFSTSTKKTIYLYPFTDSAGGRDGVQWRTVGTHLCTVLWLCRHTQRCKCKMGNWPDFSLTLTFFLLFFSDFNDMTQFSSELRLTVNPTLHFYQVFLMRNTCGSPGVKGNFRNTFQRYLIRETVMGTGFLPYGQQNVLGCLRDTTKHTLLL